MMTFRTKQTGKIVTTRRGCACFECLRRQGITRHERLDSLGLYRDRADGRYLRKMVHDVAAGVNPDGSLIYKTVTAQERKFIGG